MSYHVREAFMKSSLSFHRGLHERINKYIFFVVLL